MFAAAAVAATPLQAATPDEICTKVRDFENAPLADGQRRWVEFHWYFDPTAIWSWGCRHSDDERARRTCSWLMDHTNQEFSMRLPQRIMGCHGYGFPKFAYYDWDGINGTIELRGPTGRRILLDLNYRGLPGSDQAIRLSVQHSSDGDLPPIEPMPKDAGQKTTG